MTDRDPREADGGTQGGGREAAGSGRAAESGGSLETDDIGGTVVDGGSVDDAIEAYLSAKAKGRNAGNYRALGESVLGRWRDWLADRGVTDLSAISDQTMRRYAQHLRRRHRGGGIEAATARTYYDVVRACLAWCVEDGRLDANPAARKRAVAALPETDRRDTQQFWSPAAVRTILGFVDERAKAAVEADGPDATRELRDRALVSLLAGAGVRGAEVFRDPDDDRDGRRGLRWSRLDLDGGTAYVLGKRQSWEYAAVPPFARDHLRRHRRAQDPPTDDWPVFPTAHAPTLYRTAREGLATRGFDEDEIETLLDEHGPDAVLRDHEIAPPSITTAGARSLMRRLCDEAGVDIDGEYLKPHGARRGLGDALYRESAELAQDALRHSSVETTHEAYSHVEAGETAERVGDVLDRAWDDEDGE